MKNNAKKFDIRNELPIYSLILTIIFLLLYSVYWFYSVLVKTIDIIGILGINLYGLSYYDLLDKYHWLCSAIIQSNSTLIGLTLIVIGLPLINRTTQFKKRDIRVSLIYPFLIASFILAMTTIFALFSLLEYHQDYVIAYTNLLVFMEIFCLVFLGIGICKLTFYIIGNDVESKS